jgi:DNA topoisomerase-3
MKLYICEKPGQGRDLARNLNINGKGDGFIGNNSNSNSIAITWAIGHLIQQLEPDEVDSKYSKWTLEHLPIVPNVWTMKPNARTKKQLNVIKGLLKQSNHVVIATDGDREGEVIGRELLAYFNWSGRVDRLWLTALDDTSIQKALSHLKQGVETEPLYAAGLARARADWMVGMSATRALSIMAQKRGYRGVLSVGRVQTPTLAIVVNRDLEIEDFKFKDYYDIQGVFSGVVAQWVAVTEVAQHAEHPQHSEHAQHPEHPEHAEHTEHPQHPEHNLYFDEQKRCLNEDHAIQVANKVRAGNASVTKFETERKKVPPPLLYSLSALQQTANKKFGLSAKQVLDLAQSLYEKHKATTYPRSDCQYLPVSQFSEVKGVTSAISRIDSDMGTLIAQADLTKQSRVWNDKKLGAHHAIIPTENRQVNLSNMTTDEGKIYSLICSSYVAQFFPSYEYDKTSIEINASGELFTSSINVDVHLGWKVVINPQAKLKQVEPKQTELEQTALEPTEPKQSPVPNLALGQALSVDSIDIQTKQTKPPARYTEGTLIAAMEKAHLFVTDPNLKKVLKGNEGIGTEATRANIIDLLKKRHFLTINKKQLISSETGRALISAVPNAVKDPGMTAIMESSLSKIAAGDLTLDAFMDWQIHWLNQLIESIKSQPINIESNIKTVECPDCGKDLFLRKGRQGQFWGCSGYPQCKTTAQNNKGKALFEADMPDCPKCKKKLRRVKGKKGFFWSCKGYFDTPKCTFMTQDKAGKPVFK